MPEEIAITLSDVTAGYGRKAVVRNIDLTIYSQEVVGIVGANGAGKTTLLRAIFGKIVPMEGRINIFGSEVTARPPAEHVRRGVAYVAQGARVFPILTVQECLKMGAGTRDVDFQPVLDVFPELTGRMSQKAGSLSGGERQMLAVGMALMQRPRALLLDEPSIGLAPKLVRDLMKTIGEIRDHLRLAVLMAEQNITVILPIVSRLHVLRVGQITQTVMPKDVRTERDIRRMLL